MTSIPKPIPHLGLYLYSSATADIAEKYGLDQGAQTALLLEMAGAIRAGKLQGRVAATGGPADKSTAHNTFHVTVQDVNSWLKVSGYPYLWNADVANSITSTGLSSGAPITDVFRKMKNLTVDKLSIAFVGDKPDSGMGNNMLEISAMGETRRVPLAELDLVDRRRGSLNYQGSILLGMAEKLELTSLPKNSKRIQRLRDVFRDHLGIKSDPFLPFNKSDGWKPIFKLEDKREAKDERAKREGEFKTESWEQRNESGEKVSAYHESNDMDENDPAGLWLKEKEIQL